MVAQNDRIDHIYLTIYCSTIAHGYRKSSLHSNPKVWYKLHTFAITLSSWSRGMNLPQGRRGPWFKSRNGGCKVKSGPIVQLVITADSDSANLGSNPGGTYNFVLPSPFQLSMSYRMHLLNNIMRMFHETWCIKLQGPKVDVMFPGLRRTTRDKKQHPFIQRIALCVPAKNQPQGQYSRLSRGRPGFDSQLQSLWTSLFVSVQQLLSLVNQSHGVAST